MSATPALIVMFYLAGGGAVATATSAATGATVMVLAITAIIGAVVTVMQSIPTLLRACGADDAAGSLDAWTHDITWFAMMLTTVTIFCVIIVLLVTSPLQGWTWVVEEVRDAAGNAGLRFGLSR